MSTIPDWAHALGPDLFTARIRSQASDFVVTENLSIDFSDDGEHDLLWVEKRHANTTWVAERLADHAGVHARDVGYAGRKDRHAIARQWFSVRRRSAQGTDWDAFNADGVRILEQRRHRRKLRRGAHKGNRFRIALRANRLDTRRDDIAERLSVIASAGVPNYFGQQRFGHDGGNLDLCHTLFSGRRLSRNKRSIALSAARSFLFNQIVDARVQQHTWDKIQPGELANLDGSGSVFGVAELTPEIERRCAEQDIHPSGTLWGSAAPRATQIVAAVETEVAALHQDLCDGLVSAGVKAASRPLRLRVQELSWEIDDDALWLEFSLRRGGYATAVLREIADVSDQSKAVGGVLLAGSKAQRSELPSSGIET